MVTIEVKNIEGKTVLPIHGSEVAAGYDIVAIDDPIIVGETVGESPAPDGEVFYKRIDYLEYHTALYISPIEFKQEKHHTLLHPRSSIRKYNLVLANSIGLVDNDYRGEVIMCFKYIWQPEDFIFQYELVPINKDEPNICTPKATGKLLGKINKEKIYKRGDKIGQLVAETTNPIKFVLVNELDVTDRGEGGFGSTDTMDSSINPGSLYPHKNVSNEGTSVKSHELRGTSGFIIEQYKKSGGIPIKKKYSDEIKDQQKE
jgi:dUTP pyrophosphatase